MAARASSKTDRVIAERLMVSPLFENMTVDEVHNCFTCSGALCLSFKKGDMIFTEEDEPTKLHILLEGGVRIGYDSFDGNTENHRKLHRYGRGVRRYTAISRQREVRCIRAGYL